MIKTIFAIDSAGEFMLVSSPNFSKNPIGNDINENSEFSHGQKMGVIPISAGYFQTIKITFPINSAGKSMSVLSPNLEIPNFTSVVKIGRGPYLCRALSDDENNLSNRFSW